jgi:GNAT superfamily N-acetyltransferase
MTIRIDEATAADIPLILSFIQQLASYERLSDRVVATESNLRESLFGERPAAEAVIARCDGAPAGIAVFFQTFSTFLGRPGIYLEDLFVQDDMRGRGVGLALLAHVAQVARARGCTRVDWSVLNWNDLAIRFYRRLGAIPLSDWTLYRLSGEALERLGSQGSGG